MRMLTGFLPPSSGTARVAGFDVFEDVQGDLLDKIKRARALLSARKTDRPFFLFLHTYDIHCPYTPAEPYASMFRSEGAEPLDTEGKCGNPHYNSVELSPGQRAFLSDVYDGGIREADSKLAALFHFLSRRDWGEETRSVASGR